MNFCYKTASVWLFIGKLLFILKILIPIAIIALGSIDLGKAVISSDDKSIKTASTKLLKRIVAGICIFFIPVIIKVLFSMIGIISDEIKNDYINCINCITDPYNNCDASYEGNIYKK